MKYALVTALLFSDWGSTGIIGLTLCPWSKPLGDKPQHSPGGLTLGHHIGLLRQHLPEKLSHVNF